MAFSIKIYEKDKYMYSLMKARIGALYPEAYITDPYLDERSDSDGDMFGEFTKVLYNPKQFGEDFGLESPEVAINSLKEYLDKPVPTIGKDGLVDCKKICSALRIGSSGNSGTKTALKEPSEGRIEMLIPFVYINDRENYIKTSYRELIDADLSLRLDFTSRLRSAENESSEFMAGNMTGLLEACASRRFEPNDILKYCSRDGMGFLTPGTTKGDDDVYDIGSSRCRLLLDKCRQLITDGPRIINVLAIAEGFRSAELPELVSDCDKVTILFSGRNKNEENAASGLISSISRALTHGTILTAYTENMHSESRIFQSESDNSTGVIGAAI